MGILYNRYTPEKIVTYTVTITINNNITRTGGALVQTDLSGSMTAVTLSPKDTYRINPPSGSSGITVTASGNNYVISGTPTADVTLSFTTTQNPDILTSEQKNFGNWTPSTAYEFAFGFRINQGTVSSSLIPWSMQPGDGTHREGYYSGLTSIIPVDTPLQLSLTYKVDPASSTTSNEGCVIGVSRSARNGNIRSAMLGSITISGTQTTYKTGTFNFTRTGSSDFLYLAIVHTNYASVSGQYRAGTIYIQDMTIRQV